ncbi:MAG: hypothetical protein COV35_04380 [Alphaproteobacteria bacterium CG11_big_fil_rev_8_21_14_0_20_39_49]|nr:MAG: hypothetical protein COV35_04380 [Alphaproteobacteria bacterium CG11_big_fil_rev_8_21_14_0_20_39_49]
METTLSAKRKGDALITIRQHNNNKVVEVVGMNPAAEKLTGYKPEELVGGRIASLLPDRINESLEENIEFEDPSYDFASVARKIPNFQVKNKNGKKIEVSMKIFYLTSKNPTVQDYEILLRDIRLIKKIEELKNEIASEMNGRGSTDISTLMHAYNTAYKFIAEDPIEVTFVTLGIDNFSKLASHDEMTVSKVINKYTDIIKKTCRNEDIAAHIENGVIGLVLLDCNTQNAKDVIINRIIDNISSKTIGLFDGTEFNTTLTVCYTQLIADDNPTDIFNACIDKTLYNQQLGGNSISELFDDLAEEDGLDEERYEEGYIEGDSKY